MMKKTIHKLLALTLAFLMVAALTACGGGGGDAPSPAPSGDGQPAASGTPAGGEGGYADQIVICRNADCIALEPQAEGISPTESTVMTQIWENLVKPDSEGNIVGALAESWEISDDGLTYTFQLKPGVKFNNGTDVTVEDWAFSLIRARDSLTSSYAARLADLDTVTGEGNTLVLTLKRPAADFLANLCMFNAVVGSKAHWEAVGEEEYVSGPPVATGPYMLKEWVREQYLILEANPYYHEEGLPKTKEIKYVVAAEDSTRVMQIQAGEVDILTDVPFTFQDTIESTSGVQANIYPNTQVRYFILNTTQAPFDDINVRKALYSGINKTELAQIVIGENGAPAAGIVSDAQGKWYNDSLPLDSFDPEACKQALTDAGYTLPIKFTLSCRAGTEIYEQTAVMLKSQLDQAGFEVEIERLEGAALSDKFQSLSHQATLLQWTDDVFDPSGVVGWAVEWIQSRCYYTGLQDQALEDLFHEANVELDPDKRVEMYHEIQRQIYENANIIPLFRNSIMYATQSNITGLEVDPFSNYECMYLQKSLG